MKQPPSPTAPAPEPPLGAREVFGNRLPMARQYADALAGAGTVRGLIGPREVPRLWERHLLNCAVVADLIAPGASVCDIGSGAGLPGIVLAIRRPDLWITLVEPMLRRTTFLDEVIADLGLLRVQVVRDRAEQWRAGRTFGVVTARAVAPLDRLLPWAVPLMAGDGALIAMKGVGAHDEVAASRDVQRRLRLADPEVLALSVPAADGPTYVVRVVREGTPRGQVAGQGGPATTKLSTARNPRAERAHPQIAPGYPQEGAT